jgi:hypothetical protein
MLCYLMLSFVYFSVIAMTGTAVSPGGGSSNGGLPTSAIDKGCWTVGLINSKFKYLSAETFGFRINANGKALMKKQVETCLI